MRSNNEQPHEILPESFRFRTMDGLPYRPGVADVIQQHGLVDRVPFAGSAFDGEVAKDADGL